MTLSYKTRKRLSLLILLVGLPLYIVVAVNVVEMFGRPGVLVELLVWVALGIVWALAAQGRLQGRGAGGPGRAAAETGVIALRFLKAGAVRRTSLGGAR
jgi:hypothetical protein